ncbi:MAG: cytochrome c biogenesis protein CcsA [Cyclobacteriaceae bacterium]
MHYTIGNLGHLAVITSFVTALLSFFGYVRAARAQDEHLRRQWILNGRVAFFVHSAAVLGIGVALFYIIANHYFEYHYAYSYSDLHLPGYYLVSTFWNGQEGSFLLWMFWQAVLGLVLIRTQKTWEAPMMGVFALVQAFLASMILGVVIPGINVRIGSTPFILLRDVLNDPIFKTQPDFVPRDGNGLNPLLQNYWMVIHPPTLFLGFAATLVPFAFCMAGLWYKKYTEWVRPALAWSLFGGAVLGLGILMGGYWAYETLSFGGYWNWDPVENAVYVPWLILIASIHTLMIAHKSTSALKTSMILVTATFILILYSTFLTRSGILGDGSVHSFTDLGLSGQLLLYLLAFAFIAVLLMMVRWKGLGKDDTETSTYSPDFWIFLGVTLLCLMGFQVIVPTSYPVYNKVLGWFGINSSLAIPANQVEYFSHLQLWFAVAVAATSATAQAFWWRKMDKSIWKKEVLVPMLYSALIAVVLINLFKVYDVALAFLMLAGVYIIFSNLSVLFRIARRNASLSGGAITHIGIGLMLIGILFSAGYSRIVSLNNTGMPISSDFSTEFNRDNLLLFINEPRNMAGYDIEFLGERILSRSGNRYIPKDAITTTSDPYKVVAKTDIVNEGVLSFKKGDTLEVNSENTYYEITLSQNGSVEARLFPRIQMNPSMGMLSSPDIRRGMSKDLYTHVSAPMNREAEPDWKTHEETVRLGQKFFVNDYVAVLEEVKPLRTVQGANLPEDALAVQASIRIEGEHGSYLADPVFLITTSSTNPQIGIIASEINDLGVKLSLASIHPQTNEFTLSISTRQKDWVIIKALEKPWINVLWLGTGVLMVGFCLAMVRRFKS